MTVLYKFFFPVLWIVVASCTRSENSAIQKCIEPLTRKERNFFLAIGFFNYKKIHKWNSDLKVAITGNDIREGDRSTIDTLIMETAKLIHPLKISYANKDDEANVWFVLDKDLNNPNYAYGQAKRRVSILNLNTINYASVSIFPISKGMHRKQVMYHEMMHVLGFEHPKFLNQPFEIMNSVITIINLKTYDEIEPYYASHHKFSELDKKMIRTLYSPCIDRGMKRSDFYNAIKKHDKSK